MNGPEEYFLIERKQLPQFEKEGWRLVGPHRRPGYLGKHNNNVLVKRREERGMAKNPQDQKCDLCDAQAHCIEVSVTVAGTPGMVCVSESFWVCQVCAHNPIGELIKEAFAKFDAGGSWVPQ